MSLCTTTVPNSVCMSAPVGHTSTHAAWVQCLHTSDSMSQRKSVGSPASGESPGRVGAGMPRSTGALGAGATDASATRAGTSCSIKATCRHVDAPSAWVLS